LEEEAWESLSDGQSWLENGVKLGVETPNFAWEVDHVPGDSSADWSLSEVRLQFLSRTMLPREMSAFFAH
jgi:hypothetical protein